MDTWMIVAGVLGIIVALGGGGYLYRTAFRRGKKKAEITRRVEAEMAAEEAAG